MTKRSLILLGLVGLLVVGAFAGLKVYERRSAPRTASPAHLVVGVLSWPGVGPIYIADEKGFFRDLGLTVDIRLIESYDSRRAALAAGQIHIDATTIDQLLIYRKANVDAAIFGLSDFSTGGDGIIASKSIKSVKDLAGKRVAYAEASPSEFLLRWALRDAGLKFSEIRREPVADAQAAGTAVLAEQVDAAATYEPWLTKSRDNPRLAILVSTREYPDLIPGLLVARHTDLAGRAATYRKFMNAWFRSVNYYAERPADAKAIMARRMGLSRDELDSVLNSIRLVGSAESQKVFKKESAASLYKLIGTISEFWRESGYLTETPRADDLILPRTDP